MTRALQVLAFCAVAALGALYLNYGLRPTMQAIVDAANPARVVVMR